LWLSLWPEVVHILQEVLLTNQGMETLVGAFQVS